MFLKKGVFDAGSSLETGAGFPMIKRPCKPLSLSNPTPTVVANLVVLGTFDPFHLLD